MVRKWHRDQTLSRDSAGDPGTEHCHRSMVCLRLRCSARMAHTALKLESRANRVGENAVAFLCEQRRAQQLSESAFKMCFSLCSVSRGG
jgi:hypothetical protein